MIWRKYSVTQGYGYLLATLIYFFPVIISEKTRSSADWKVLAGGVCILGFLPCVRVTHSYSSLWQAISGVVLLLTIIIMEWRLSHRFALVTYFVMAISFRVIRDHTVVDNVALCVAYLWDLQQSAEKFYSDVLFLNGLTHVVCTFVMAMLLEHYMTKAYCKQWDSIRGILIYREKCRKVTEMADRLLLSHFPEIRPGYRSEDSSASHQVSQRIDSSEAMGLRKRLTSSGVIADVEDARALLDKARGLTGYRRCPALVLCFKHVVISEKECANSYVNWCAINDFLDSMARRECYRISVVRSFGNVWVGCLGFDHSWGSGAEDCFRALKMASESLSFAAKMNWRLSCAMDHGAVLGGRFGNCSMDLLGPEVRWILAHADVRKAGYVLVSQNVSQLLQRHNNFAKEDCEVVKFDHVLVHSVVRSHPEDKVLNAILQLKPEDVELEALLTRPQIDVDNVELISLLEENHRTINPSQKLFRAGSSTVEVGEKEKMTKSDVMGNFGLHAPPRTSLTKNSFGYRLLQDVWHRAANIDVRAVANFFTTRSSEEDEILYSDVASLFPSLDDPVLSKYDEETLERVHQELEHQCDQIVRVAVLKSYLNYLLLRTPSRHEEPKHYEGDRATTRRMTTVNAHTINRSKETTGGWSKVVNYQSDDLLELAAAAIDESSANLSDDDIYHSDSIVLATEAIHESLDARISGVARLKPKNTRKATLNFSKFYFDFRNVFIFQYFRSALLLFYAFFTFLVITIMQFDIVRERAMEVYAFLLVLHTLMPVILDETFEFGLYMFFLPVRAFFILGLFFVSVSTKLESFQVEYTKKESDQFGEMIGASFALNLLLLAIPLAVRQRFRTLFADFLVCQISWLLLHLFKGELISGYSLWVSIVICCMRLTTMHLMEYACYVTFVCNREVMPVARQSYMDHIAVMHEVIETCSPKMPRDGAHLLFPPHHYRKAAVVAVHVKAADVLPGLVGDRETANFIIQINKIIDNCISDHKMLKISQFSGVFLAVACEDSGWNDIDALSVPIDAAKRAVVFVRNLQKSLREFNRKWEIHVTVGIGMTLGPVQMGLLGNYRRTFDIIGSMRDVAVCMATLTHQEGVYASDAYSEFGQFDSARRVKATYHDGKESTWLLLSETFSGMDLEDFEYICMLGRGGYGSVHLLCEKDTGTRYAIKSIPRKVGQSQSTMIQREFLILQQLHHRNVVSFQYCLVYKHATYLVMSFVDGGNLKQVVDRYMPNIDELRTWFAELVLALEYVHSRGIIHRDVKPANCMIGSNGHLQLADFGLAVIVDPDVEHSSKKDISQEISCDPAKRTMLDLLKKIIPLKPKISSGVKGLPEKPFKVLLIDSEEPSSTLASLNQLHIFDVTCVTTLAAARSILDGEIPVTFELILLDLDSDADAANELVEADSHELDCKYKFLRDASKDSTFVPVLALSDEDDNMLHAEVTGQGAKDYIIKPIEKAEGDKIMRWVRTYRILSKKNEEFGSGTGTGTGRRSEPSTGRRSANESAQSSRASSAKTENAAVSKSKHSNQSAIFDMAGEAKEGMSMELPHDDPESSATEEEEDDLEDVGSVAYVAETNSVNADSRASELIVSVDRSNSGKRIEELTVRSEVEVSVRHSDSQKSDDDNQVRSFSAVSESGGLTVAQSRQKTASTVPGKEDKRFQMHSAVGTVHYMAPEVILEGKYGRAVDWWACGVTFFECVARKHLFEGMEKNKIVLNICTHEINLTPILPTHYVLANLITCLLRKEPEKRLGTDLGAYEVKNHEFFADINWAKVSRVTPIFRPARRILPDCDENEKAKFYGMSYKGPRESRYTDGKPTKIPRRRRRVNHHHQINKKVPRGKTEFLQNTSRRISWINGISTTPQKSSQTIENNDRLDAEEVMRTRAGGADGWQAFRSSPSGGSSSGSNSSSGSVDTHLRSKMYRSFNSSSYTNSPSTPSSGGTMRPRQSSLLTSPINAALPHAFFVLPEELSDDLDESGDYPANLENN